MQNNQNKSINVERIKAHVDQFGSMMPMYAKVIEFSKCLETGAVLTTFELFFPRYILAEQNTHRIFSRNTGSSRAIPLLRMLKELRGTPVVPLFWGANKSGMQSAEELPKWKAKLCHLAWYIHRVVTFGTVKFLHKMGLHKQWANRLLEPHTYIRQVVTSSSFDNYFDLRLHDDAQPEIIALAYMMQKALAESKPKLISNSHHEIAAGWHLPYITLAERAKYMSKPKFLAKLSAARCARTSYLTQEGVEPKPAKELNTFKKLAESKPMHCFDSNTEVLTDSGFKLWSDVTESDLLADVNVNTLEFKGFVKPLELIKGKHTGKMYSVQSKDCDFRTTSDHTMISLGNRGNDIIQPFILSESAVGINLPSDKSKGEQEHKLPTAVITEYNSEDENSFYLGKLWGFYLGDGFRIDNTIGFHLKKERKIVFIEQVLSKLKLNYSLNKNLDNTAFIRVSICNTVIELLNTFSFGTKGKLLPLTPFLGLSQQAKLQGLFDGLKNSDGSVKRKTWVFSTSNENIKQGILNLAPLAGLTIGSVQNIKGCYSIGFNTTNKVRINDSRRIETKVEITDVIDEPVWCATMPSGALISRRNGKVLVTGNSSPLEHQAYAMKSKKGQSHNLVGFKQYRETYELEEFGKTIEEPTI